MNILIIGQCTLHWGRMEFGNIGNYYIIEPFVRELHKNFPGSEIRTTFQMSEGFCVRERITVVSMEYYYGWTGTDLEDAKKELQLAREYDPNKADNVTTPYMDQALWADLVIDFSGDIWGDNADLLGADRFLVGLLKDRTAQLLGKKTVMLAGSPGPFENDENIGFAKEVYSNFDLVTNRESISIDILNKYGFDTQNTLSLACPAFLFEPSSINEIKDIVSKYDLNKGDVVGFILCGWNFTEGPFDKWPREDRDYIQFAELIEEMEKTYGVRVCLMSHSNGFIPGKQPFELIHGRDYPVTKQLQKILEDRGIAKNVFCLDDVYDTWTTKAIISTFSMLISGRVHAAVAGMSQSVPTVIIDYGHEPKAHKLRGFAKSAGMERFVADPAKYKDLLEKAMECWEQRENIKEELNSNIPNVKATARKNFEVLKKLV